MTMTEKQFTFNDYIEWTRKFNPLLAQTLDEVQQRAKDGSLTPEKIKELARKIVP